MCTLYENIKSLCEENGVTGGKMCVDLGISKSLMTSLKSGRTQNISVDNARKIAEYFNVSVSRVLGTDQNKKSPAPEGAELKISDDDMKHLKQFHRADPATKEAIRLLLLKFSEEEHQ